MGVLYLALACIQVSRALYIVPEYNLVNVRLPARSERHFVSFGGWYFAMMGHRLMEFLKK